MTKKQTKTKVVKTTGKPVITYNSSPVRLHAILKKLFIYVLRKGLSWWRGKRISFENCPIKIKVLIAGKIRSKKVLDALFKKNKTLKPFVYEGKQKLASNVQKICLYFKNNKQRSNQETQKMVQILNNFKGFIPHLLRRESHGVAKFNPALYNYYNKQFQNFFYEVKFSQQILNGDDFNMQTLLQSCEKKILSELKNKKEETTKEWEDSKQDEKDLVLEFENYNTQKFDLFQHQFKNQYVPLEEQRINFVLKYIFQLQQYLQGFGYLNTGIRKDKHYRFLPRAVNTENLLKEQEQYERRRDQSMFDQLLDSPMYLSEEHVMAAQQRTKAAKRRQNIRKIANHVQVEVLDSQSEQSSQIFVQGNNKRNKPINKKSKGKKEQAKAENKYNKKQLEKIEQMQTQQGFFQQKFSQIEIDPEFLKKNRQQVNQFELRKPFWNLEVQQNEI